MQALNVYQHRRYLAAYVLDPLHTGNPRKGAFANSEDPDEIHHNVALHQGLQCFLRLKQGQKHIIKTIFRDRNT